MECAIFGNLNEFQVQKNQHKWFDFHSSIWCSDVLQRIARPCEEL